MADKSNAAVGEPTSLVDLFPGKKKSGADGWTKLLTDLWDRANEAAKHGPNSVGTEFQKAYADGRAGEYLSGAAGTALNSALLGQLPRTAGWFEQLMKGTDGAGSQSDMRGVLNNFAHESPGSSLTANLGGAMATLPVGGAVLGAGKGLLRGAGEVLPEAWQGAIQGVARAAMHPVAAPAAMGAAAAGLSRNSNPDAPLSEHLANGAASAAGTALLGRMPGLLDEVPAFAQTNVGRFLAQLRGRGTIGSPARIEPQLSFPPQGPPSGAATALPGPFAGSGGRRGPLPAPESAAPAGPGIGMSGRSLSNLPSPASSAPDLNASIVDLSNAVATLRGSQGAAVVKPATGLTPSQATDAPGLAMHGGGRGKSVPGDYPRAPQQTVRMPFDEPVTAPPPPAPKPQPLPRADRVMAEQSALKAGLGRLADAVDASPSLDVTKLKNPAAAEILGPGYTPAHVRRVLISAKTQAQTANKNGEPVAQALRKIANDPTTTVYKYGIGFEPKPVPQRPFSDDYPGLLGSGPLAATPEGVPLSAPFIAGRRIIGGGDIGLTPLERRQVAESLASVSRVGAKELPRGAVGSFGKGGGSPSIKVKLGLDPVDEATVVAHETGHAIDDLAGGISGAGHSKALDRIYSDLWTGQPGHNPPTTPRNLGYTPEQVPAERIAEAVRAYIADPNYIKSVSPTLAATIRQAVNRNPRIAKIIQFNSIAAASALGMGGLLGDSQPADAAAPDRHSQSGRFLNASGSNSAGDRR